MNRDASTVYIAMGANLGDRADAIEAALRLLDDEPSVRVTKRSALIETSPVGPDGGELAGQPSFLNGCAELRTMLTPRQTLDLLLDVERRLGRRRSESDRWAARAIDLDLLLYDDRIIKESGLTVPHPRMHRRRFVLHPLAEIAPGVVHPGFGVSIQELLNRLVGAPAGRTPPTV